MDHTFVHRQASREGKDGNPLNEVHVLYSSLLLNKGKRQLQIAAMLVKLGGGLNQAATGEVGSMTQTGR
jgi:hypothetical protein